MLRCTSRALGQACYSTNLKAKLREGDVKKLLEEVAEMGQHGQFVAEELGRTVAELNTVYKDVGAEEKESDSGDAVRELTLKAYKLYPLHLPVPKGYRKAAFSEVSPYLPYLREAMEEYMTIVTSDAVLVSSQGLEVRATPTTVYFPNTVILTPKIAE